MDKKPAFIACYFSIDPEITQAQLKAKKELPECDFSAISAVKQRMDKNGICYIVQKERTDEKTDQEQMTLKEVEYPEKLLSVSSSPYIVYYQGDITLLDRPILGIVGPRKISSYGERIMKNLFHNLATYHMVTLSGMADGTDTLCHELSMQYNIPTIAVLGGGFSHFLRGKKRELMKRIVEQGGLILSEYKHGFIPTNRSFPQRNRLIGGIADVLFLPEAQEKSGSLITADEAYKKRKSIYAPMGDILQQSSAGTNNYIIKGKIQPLDHLELFLEKHFQCFTNHSIKTQSIMIDLEPEEKVIVDIVAEHGETSIDILLDKTKYTSGCLLTYVNILEVKGAIYESSPGIYKVK